MKKIITLLAIILLFSMAYSTFSSGLNGNGFDFNFDIFGDTETTDSPGTSEPSTDTAKPSTDTSSVTTEAGYKYTYRINFYKQGTSTKLGEIERESNNPTATLRISGNIIYFDAVDRNASIQFTDIESIDSLSVTTVSPGTTSVYITYTSEDSETGTETSHEHMYTVTEVATCTTSGTKSCSCGDTLTISALGHNYYEADPPSCEYTGSEQCSICGYINYLSPTGHNYIYPGEDCQQQACCECGASGGPFGPHDDNDGDGKCDLCNTSM